MSPRNTISLRFATSCADPDCGALLPAGSEARYYGRNRAYGLHCHPQTGRTKRRSASFHALATRAMDSVGEDIFAALDGMFTSMSDDGLCLRCHEWQSGVGSDDETPVECESGECGRYVLPPLAIVTLAGGRR